MCHDCIHPLVISKQYILYHLPCFSLISSTFIPTQEKSCLQVWPNLSSLCMVMCENPVSVESYVCRILWLVREKKVLHCHWKVKIKCKTEVKWHRFCRHLTKWLYTNMTSILRGIWEHICFDAEIQVPLTFANLQYIASLSSYVHTLLQYLNRY